MMPSGTNKERDEGFSLVQWLRCHQYVGTWTAVFGIGLLILEAFTR